MLSAVDRGAAVLSRLTAICGTAGLVFLTAVICYDVVGRYFGAPLYGAQDLSSMALVVVIFGGMAICDRTDNHIVVDVFQNVFPDWVNQAGDVLAAILGAVIFGMIAYTAWDGAALSRLLGLSTNIIEMPKAWFQYFVLVASLIAALGMGMRAVALMTGTVLERQDMPA